MLHMIQYVCHIPPLVVICHIVYFPHAWVRGHWAARNLKEIGMESSDSKMLKTKT